LRAAHDAVAVGVGTALADDPELTVRAAPAPRVPPLRVVFDRHARLPLDGRLARTARETPVVVVCDAAPPPERAAALEAAGVRLLRAASLADALAALRGTHGVRHLFVEGGARLAGGLWGADAVDRLITFQSPVVLGEGAVRAFEGAPPERAEGAPRLPVVARRLLGDDLMTVYAVHPVPTAPGPSGG
jgi:diaminohydroxyphosphoribosylaminopyrimidine deaminase/5-amino-6-(5-phosphoribosylamino)uracil reductase